MVTNSLRTAFDEASKLPEDEQEAFAAWILEELESDRRWIEAFANSQDALEKLADEALEDFRSGRISELNPDEL